MIRRAISPRLAIRIPRGGGAGPGGRGAGGGRRTRGFGGPGVTRTSTSRRDARLVSARGTVGAISYGVMGASIDLRIDSWAERSRVARRTPRSHAAAISLARPARGAGWRLPSRANRPQRVCWRDGSRRAGFATRRAGGGRPRRQGGAGWDKVGAPPPRRLASRPPAPVGPATVLNGMERCPEEQRGTRPAARSRRGS